jgi:ankyrin repeat protein
MRKFTRRINKKMNREYQDSRRQIFNINMNDFIKAIENNDIDLINHCIINRLIDLDIKDFNGKTVLHYACYNGNIEIVKLLIEAGADINAKDIYGNTPLYWTYTADIIQLLFRYGVNVEIVSI